MIAQETLASVWPTVALLAAAGFVLGRGYFGSLRRSVRLSVTQGASSTTILSALARIAAAALFFTLAVRWGVPALLAAFAGFLAARQLAVRSARRVP